LIDNVGSVCIIFFKLVEEETPTLLLLLPYLFAETAVFGSASGSGCYLVVATVQATDWACYVQSSIISN
jgi:hypothetical protein